MFIMSTSVNKLIPLHLNNIGDTNHQQSRHSIEEIKSEEGFKLMDSKREDRSERRKIIQVHEEKNAKMNTLHQKEEILLEKGFNAELTQLMSPKKRDDKFNKMKEFEEEREKLVELHQKKTTEMKSRHQKEEIKIEEGNNAELTNLVHSEKRKEKFEDIEEFAEEREKLMKLHDTKLAEMNLKEGYNAELTKWMHSEWRRISLK